MSKKKVSAVKSRTDDALVSYIYDDASDYGVQFRDGDGYRLGEKFFLNAGNKMMSGVQELFNRMAKTPARKHRPLRPVFDRLAKLSTKDRCDVEKVYRALCDVKGSEIPFNDKRYSAPDL